MSDEPIKDGYYFQRDGVVRIHTPKDSALPWCTYVQITPDGRVMCGGHSSWVTDLRPITDPYHMAAAKLFEARRKAESLEKRARFARAEVEKWEAVWTVMNEAKMNADAWAAERTEP